MVIVQNQRWLSLGNLDNLGQDLVDMFLVIGRGSHDNRGMLPSVLIVQFRDGHIEMTAYTVFETRQDGTLFLERWGG